MTTNSYSPAPIYTISGIGPYDVPHEYTSSDELTVSVVINEVSVALGQTDYTVVPVGPTTSGTVFLTVAAATAYDGEALTITRASDVNQSWISLSSTAVGLEEQLDQMTRAIQETQVESAHSLRVLEAPIAPYEPRDGCVPYWDNALASFANGLNYSDLVAGIAVANAANDQVDVAIHAITGGKWRSDAATIIADTDLTYTPDQSDTVEVGSKVISQAEGFAYAVAASDAVDHHVTTAGGVKLYVLPVADGSYSVTAFGAVGDGTTDDTTALQAAIGTAESAEKTLVFPRADYLFSSPLTITGIDVAFQKSILRYAGPPGDFALTLNSISGASNVQRNGNRFSDLNLIQEDWTEYVTYTGSTTFDPPTLASYANVTNVTPTFTTATVTVPGARAGGYARVTFDQLADGCTVCGEVTNDDEVTVYFNNYVSSAIDMPSGTLSVEVVNFAYHGLCLGGALGVLENYKVLGFTGVSMGMGSGLCQITGVRFPSIGQCYYWITEGNLAPAAGWGLVVQPRNNENNLALTLFPIDAYGDAIPKRACTINQVVMSGVTNNFRALSLESVSSEETLLLTHACNLITSSKPVYFEANPDFVAPPEPFVRAEGYSSACDLNFRMYGGLGKVVDEGVANDLRVMPAFYINGQAQQSSVGGESLVANGDFVNGTNHWDNWSSNSTMSIPGEGFFSGQRVRIDVVGGRPNLQQEVDKHGPAYVGTLAGRTVTFAAWIKTDLDNIVLRVNGNPSPKIPPDGAWHFCSLTMRNDDPNAIDLSVLENGGVNQTGYIEVANVTGLIGNRAVAFGPATRPTGQTNNFNPPSLADGARTTTTVTVQGAALGDHVIGVSFSRDLAGVRAWGYVSAADTVTVVFENDTGATFDLAPGTLRVVVEKA